MRIKQSNKYMREYMKKRYHTLRNELIVMLGGKCVQCGSTQRLEFDHINPSEKEYSIADMCSLSKEKLDEEIKKCQLLCYKDHKKKHSPKEHGTLAMYRYCKCDLCKKANTEYNRKYRMGLKLK